ncbi:MAG: FHA domain-containing protein [Polyangia bacterium]|jgi:pSer/pThr/pTyr-binding forkhead associated (FHA) protein|nr:FHA domain-containing protein [Polyangia bacterium]
MAQPAIHLRIWTAGGPVHTLRLGGQAVVIGRSRAAGVRLLSPEVSGAHARLEAREGLLWLEDLASANGTTLEGRRLDPRQARPISGEAVFEIGPYSLSAALTISEEAVPDPGPEGTATLAAELLGELVAAGGGPPATLQVSAGGGVEHRCVLLPGRTLRVGRDPAWDIGAGDPDLSRHHAELRMEACGALVVDLGSKNGTYLNGRRLTAQAALVSGDRLRLGGTEILYEDPAEAMLKELDGEGDGQGQILPEAEPVDLDPPEERPREGDAQTDADADRQSVKAAGEGEKAPEVGVSVERGHRAFGALLLVVIGAAVTLGALWALGRLFF